MQLLHIRLLEPHRKITRLLLPQCRYCRRRHSTSVQFDIVVEEAKMKYSGRKIPRHSLPRANPIPLPVDDRVEDVVCRCMRLGSKIPMDHKVWLAWRPIDEVFLL